MVITMKLTHIIPKPIREKLYPYKMKLTRKHLEKAYRQAQSAGQECEPKLFEEMRTLSMKYDMNYIQKRLECGWEKPGEMFDELGKVFEENNKLFLIGEHADVSRLTKKLQFTGVPIDSVSIPAKELLRDEEQLNRISLAARERYTFIISYPEADRPDQVALALMNRGRHFLNVNLFYDFNFCGTVPRTGDFCSIFAVYTNGKVYMKHQNMLVTTVCNLRCEYCLNYNPYNRKQRHFDLDELKRCADIYFSRVDHVGFFELTGGEPMLYPQLRDIIQYIASHYGDRIDEFTFVTNASVVPDDEFCEFLKENNVIVLIDDYSPAVPKLTPTLDELKKKLDKAGTSKIVYPPVREFLKSFPPQRGNLDLGKEELQKKYRDCTIGVQNLRDGKLCSCTYHAFAVNAGLQEDDPDDWFDIGQMSDSLADKKKLVEFRCGFNKKGYTDWCRFCNGVQTINTHYAPAAEQVKGFLEWDKDNPTFLDE